MNVTHHITSDGSSTLCSNKFGVHYHSQHGAVTESQHIFIDAGLKNISIQGKVNILEVGFGTGLNAALTASHAISNSLKVSYTSLELYPLTAEEIKLLNYNTILPEPTSELWQKVCDCSWGKSEKLTDEFEIQKLQTDFTTWVPNSAFHLIYFDAFAPNDQPEMWEPKQFKKIFDAMHPGGILVTYSVKGVVKTALSSVGFVLERLPGPPGKRHMLRAQKPC
ncbi:MAG TPA: tRNA (5-methylaminomethyl-2-thiouridine)(34)-methyltransferase MnmD [Tenuifilaceae bacterium]|nr:tRNA (5-methylaminomethyl-2-thiouridine)(34)-methyltransferase MnmD [Tenuifilaceae bacterium]